MPVYTIDLALHSACHDYAGLMAALQRAGARPVMAKRWLVDVGDDMRGTTIALLRLCAPGDALFVVELSREPSREDFKPCANAARSRPAPRQSRPAGPCG